jgi:hypothetical protein
MKGEAQPAKSIGAAGHGSSRTRQIGKNSHRFLILVLRALSLGFPGGNT